MKKMSKVLALALTLAMIVGATLATGVITASADDVTVWEGTIDMDFTTQNTVAIINTDDTLTQAIRDDLAQNGVATKYTLTSSDSAFVSGDSGYCTFGFYQDADAAKGLLYVEAWSDKGSTMNSATWTDTATLANFGAKINLCLFSDGTGDVGHVGSIKLVATHSAGATPVTTQAAKPPVDPDSLVKEVLWTGTFDQDFTTSSTMAMLKSDEMNDAIRNDIATNGTATAYVVEATGSYVSGESGYASYVFYQETPAYLEAWADKGSSVTSAVWTNTSELAQMGNKVQLALACDTDGDVIHIDTLTIYVSRSGLPSQSQTNPVVTDPIVTEPTVTEPIVTEPIVTDPIVTEPTVTEPVSEVIPGDANGDGKISMTDVLTLRKLLAGVLTTSYNEANSDVNGDGKITMADVLALRKALAK